MGTSAIRGLRLLFLPTVRRALRRRFSEPEARSILDDAWDDFEQQRPHLQKEKAVGARLMVHAAALTAGFYRALRARDVSDEEARRLTADVTGLVYEKMAGVPWMIARLSSRTRRGRLERATRAFRRFPFGPPSYQMVDIPGDEDVVAFDVRRCPVAEHLRAQGLSALCADAWCDLDFPLAKKWGARLERPLTLARGADRCDFRWRLDDVRSPAARRPAGSHG
jgi:ubiquinone biosynthesis protein